jgi:hypothetical protein
VIKDDPKEICTIFGEKEKRKRKEEQGREKIVSTYGFQQSGGWRTKGQ